MMIFLENLFIEFSITCCIFRLDGGAIFDDYWHAQQRDENNALF